jgi:hypothetical protein
VHMEEEGLTSLDPGEVKPVWNLPLLGHPSLESDRLWRFDLPHPESSSMTGTSGRRYARPCVGSKGRSRERGPGEGARRLTRTASLPVLRCAPPIHCHLPKRRR